MLPSVRLKAADAEERILEQYQEYESHFQSIERQEDVEENGYRIMEEQVFPVVFESFSEEELTFIPAIEKTWHRLAFFVADAQGNILYKRNELETNHLIRGQMLQPVKGIAAVSFTDVNRDGLTDIILLTRCVNSTGNYAGIPYKVGDVLFQEEGAFYRDWRISDKINRFGMNKSADCMISFVRDGESAEFL